jgi:hypothetical protein
MGGNTRDLAHAVAERLRGSRNEVTHEWLHRLIGRLDATAYASLPVQYLREVAPPVVEWLADRIIEPQTSAEEIRKRFREAVELQRSRGRHAGEVARDVELLADSPSICCGTCWRNLPDRLRRWKWRRWDDDFAALWSC